MKRTSDSEGGVTKLLDMFHWKCLEEKGLKYDFDQATKEEVECYLNVQRFSSNDYNIFTELNGKVSCGESKRSNYQLINGPTQYALYKETFIGFPSFVRGQTCLQTRLVVQVCISDK